MIHVYGRHGIRSNVMTNGEDFVLNQLGLDVRMGNSIYPVEVLAETSVSRSSWS